MKKRADWARLWIKKAESDLITAEACLKIRPYPPVDTICFHAQQCAEKYLKSFLAYKGVTFEKTHDLSDLIFLAAKTDDRFKELDEIGERLTPYAVEARYPSLLDDELTLKQAKEAVRLALDLKSFVSSRMDLEDVSQKKL
jgi:HEPN domain-containing protein